MPMFQFMASYLSIAFSVISLALGQFHGSGCPHSRNVGQRQWVNRQIYLKQGPLSLRFAAWALPILVMKLGWGFVADSIEHDDAMTHGRFPCYWLFGRRIGPVLQIFAGSFVVGLDKLLNTQSNCSWMETPWHSFDVMVMTYTRFNCYIKLVLCRWDARVIAPKPEK